MKYAWIDYFLHRGIWQILWRWSLQHGINSREYDHGIHSWFDIILSWIEVCFMISNIVKVEVVFFFNFVVDHLSFFMICSNLIPRVLSYGVKCSERESPGNKVGLEVVE